MQGRSRWIALGAVVLCTLSFQPWYAVRRAYEVDGFWVKTVTGRNAWQASPLWAAGVAAGFVAVLVWFGAVKRWDLRTQRVIAAVFLLAAIVLVAQKYRPYSMKGEVAYDSFLVLTDGHGNTVSSKGEYISERDFLSAGIEPAQRAALATLAVMLGLVLLKRARAEGTDADCRL